MGPPALLGSTPLIAIVRFHEGGDLAGTVAALTEGGVGLVEITLDTPGALDAIRTASEAGLSVGAGTVLTVDEVRASADAGARFVVSPGLVPEVVAAALEAGLEALPGVLTPTELLQALAAGARAVKLFPASPGGPALVRALRGPFPNVPLVPTGGVRVSQIASYLEAGATAVALGSELVGRAAPCSDGELEAIRSRAVQAAKAATA